MDHSGQVIEQNSSQADGGSIWLVLRRGAKPDFCRSAWRPGRILVLDGYEQLSYLGRLAIAAETRMKRMGLLVTSHRRVRLPTLVTTLVTPEAMRRIVQQAAVQAGVGPDAVPRVGRLQELLDCHHGNAREVMMQLYDEFGRDAADVARANQRVSAAEALDE